MGNVTHAKVSAIADGDDVSLVRPSDWNADHAVSAPVNDDDVATKQYVDDADEVLDYGLSFRGEITTLTDTTHFKVASLLGFGTGFFIPASGAPYEIYVVQADGAAPEGEQTPVIAYTSSDGTFQHTAFSASLAVGDIVLIQHPVIASLGTKASAAATGAVTTTDYLMAYVKQLVTELIVVDTVVDGIQADLSNETDGLGRLLAYIIYYGDKLDAPAGLGGLAPTLTHIIGLLNAAGGLGGIPATLAAFYLMFVDSSTGFAAIKNTVAAVHTLVTAVQTDLDNGTDGLGALKILIDAIKTVVDTITPAGPTKTEMDNGHALLATEAKQDIIDTIVDNIDDAVQHISHIYPDDTNLTCTLTALNTANTWSAWVEITDSGANTLSAIFAAVAGHISSIVVETISEDNTIYMVEIAYGVDKVTLETLRFAGGTKFQAPNVQNRMWSLPFVAGETIYYRMKSATAVADTCTVHFRYHLH